jgi:hypothetical protein
MAHGQRHQRDGVLWARDHAQPTRAPRVTPFEPPFGTRKFTMVAAWQQEGLRNRRCR